MMPESMDSELAQLGAIIAIAPSLVYHLFPFSLKIQVISTALMVVIFFPVVIGAVIFGLSLYGAITEGRDYWVVDWINIWFVPFLLNLSFFCLLWIT